MSVRCDDGDDQLRAEIKSEGLSSEQGIIGVKK